MLLYLAYDAQLATLKEVDDSVDFLSRRHLFLNLIDCIKYTGLSVEHQTIGIGDVADDLVGCVRRLEQCLVDATVAHGVVGSYDERRNILRDAHTAGDHRCTTDAHVSIQDDT